MKKVIIIEDDFKEYERIKSIIDCTFTCPQQYTDKDFKNDTENNFIDNLKTSLKVTCPDKKYDEQERKTHLLKSELIDCCNEDDDPIYLIDYKLDGGGKVNNINGIRFRDKILKTMYLDKIIPVLFITSANRGDLRNVMDYVNSINDTTICNYMIKPDHNNWNSVQNEITDFINNAQSKPRTVDNLKDYLNQFLNKIFNEDVKPQTKELYQQNINFILTGKIQLTNRIKSELDKLSLFDEHNLNKLNKLIKNEDQ